jgi:hypothetical protein
MAEAVPAVTPGCTLPPVVDRGRTVLVDGTVKNWSASLVKSAQDYQRKAEECRQRANCAVHPDDKAGWLLAAQDWRNLALWAERTAEQRGLAAALSVVGSTG